VRRKRDQRGAAAVEFALVLPILAIMLFGIITGGLSYSHALGVTNAVREGARFGATADASATTGSSWSSDVIAQVRSTQFDDNLTNPSTTVCVQLWKIGTGVVRDTICTGPDSSLSIANDANVDPKVPTGPAGSCVVRVLADRPYNIFIVVTNWNRQLVRGAVAHYERKDKVTACG